MLHYQDALVATGIVLPLLGVFTIGLRFHVRMNMVRASLGLDDWFIAFAGVLVLLLGALQVADVYRGVAGQDGPVGPQFTNSRERLHSLLVYVTLVIEKPLFGAIKLSVLFFFRRIFGSTRQFRQATTFFIVLNVIWTAVYFFLEVFQCGSKPSRFWNAAKECPRYGIPDHPIFLQSFGITDVIIDGLILILPYPEIRKLQMPLRERWALAGIFLLGWLSTAAGILRLTYVTNATEIAQRAMATGDVTPIYTPPTLWTTIEICIGVIAASLPPLAPLIRKVPSPNQLIDSARRKVSASRSRVNLLSTVRSRNKQEKESLETTRSMEAAKAVQNSVV